MLLLYSICAGLVLGKAMGGHVSGLAQLPVRWAPLAIAGLVLQLALFADPIASRVGSLGPWLYVASTLAVLAALLRNVRLPGFWLIAVGAALNLLVILANGGFMPSSPDAWRALNGVAALPTTEYSNSTLETARTLFAFLGDNFVLPRPIPFANVFSIGDVLIGLGAAWCVIRAMRSAGSAQPLAATSGPATKPATAIGIDR
jgi:hypothetical protein